MKIEYRKEYQFTAARISCQIPYTNVTILVTRYQLGLHNNGIAIKKTCQTINAVQVRENKQKQQENYWEDMLHWIKTVQEISKMNMSNKIYSSLVGLHR